MDANVKQAWIAKLRSGEVKQGKGTLNHKNERFCCLGVLSELCFKKAGVEKTTPYTNGDIGYDGYVSFLPFTIRHLAGLEEGNPSFQIEPGPFSQIFSLAELNDSGFTFDQIADVIERFF